MKNCITSAILWSIVTPTMWAVDSNSYNLPDPTDKGLFKGTTKVVRGFFTAEWMIKGSAALFSIGCFISSGNLARQGHYGRAAGAAIGGIISSIGAYLVTQVQG